MAEPNLTVVTGALAGAAVSPITLVFGAHVDALVVGLAAAFFVSIWLHDINSHTKAASAVLLSAMLAAYGSPAVAGWLVSTVPALGNADSLRLLSALLIGASSPSIVPLALKALGNKIGGVP